jgi:glutathione S-transferase
MLELTVFPPGFSEISGSPFAVKAICLMEQSGQDYQLNITPDPSKAPKRKFPVLAHDGKTIPDSDQIRDYMEQTFDVDFDTGLTPAQRGQSRSIIRMVEEHLYFAIVANRWQNDAHWPVVQKEFFGGMPKLLYRFVPNMIRKKVIGSLAGQGMGRHSYKEQVARAAKDIAAIEATLGKQDFLFGDTPSAADYSVVPMLRALASFPIENALSDLVKSRPVLVAYLDRGKAAFYPK